ncbi:hypothetical protein OQA88_8602 [Cercophora sp. LCS_1]
MFHSIALIALATLGSAFGPLQQRCTPITGPEYYKGTKLVVPCWLDQSPTCSAVLRKGTEIFIDAKHGTVVVYGVLDLCMEFVAEEIARSLDGRKTYGWLQNHGTLMNAGGGTLVISNMTEKAVTRYQRLDYWTWPKPIAAP